MNVREWALPVYTILMQLATGTIMMLWLIRAASASRLEYTERERMLKVPVLIVWVTIVVAMIGAHFHLSKPLYSLLAVLNFYRSWLSREIVFTILIFLTTGLLAILQWFLPNHRSLIALLGYLAIIFGLATVYCMARIYLLPTQTAWNSPLTIISFYMSTLFLGCVATPAVLLVDWIFSNIWVSRYLDQYSEITRKVLGFSASIVVVVWFIVMLLTFYQLTLLRTGDAWAQTSYNLMIELYLPLLVMRIGLPLIGIVVLLNSVFRVMRERRIVAERVMAPVYIACITGLVGEILGRFLFYAIHVRIGV